jgi:hypothetical protein
MISVESNFVSVMFQYPNHTATHACQFVEALPGKPMASSATKNTWANPGVITGVIAVVIAGVRGSTATTRILQDNAPIGRAAYILGLLVFRRTIQVCVP